MIHTIIKHYIIDYVLNNLFDKYTNEFTESKYITYEDINKSHLYKYISMFIHGDETVIESKKWVDNNYLVVDYMQIVTFDDIKHLISFKEPIDFSIIYPSWRLCNFFILVKFKSDGSISPATAIPFDEFSSAILK